MRRVAETAEPLGPMEIAQRLGVTPGTVHQWRYRGLLPEPDYVLSERPIWQWGTIKTWARATGRLA